MPGKNAVERAKILETQEPPRPATYGVGAGKGISLEQQIIAEQKELEIKRAGHRKLANELMASRIPLEDKKWACSDLRWQFKKCTMDSDCVKGGKLPSDCLKERKVDEYCYDVYFAYTQCMRRKSDPRFRQFGPNPGVTTGKKEGQYTV